MTNSMQAIGYTSGKTEVKELNPLAKAIADIVKVMGIDFKTLFIKKFSDLEYLKDYKNRLYFKLKEKKYLPCDVMDGYEDWIDSKPKYLPDVPDVLVWCEKARSERLKREKSQAKANRIAELPAPTIKCNPLEMLAQAKANVPEDESPIERKNRREELLVNHAAVLVIHGRNVKKIYADHLHLCEVNGCNKAGGISSSTTGNGNFYCEDHFRMA